MSFQSIYAILDNDEEIIWSERPNIKAAFIGSGAVILLVVAAILAFNIMFSSPDSSFTATCTINGKPGSPEECAQATSFFSYFLPFIMVLGTLFYIATLMVTQYAFTAKRVIIKSGLIGADLRSIYFKQLKDMSVNVGLMDKIFGTGTIRFDTGSNFGQKKERVPSFAYIDHPYEVYKLVQEHMPKD